MIIATKVFKFAVRSCLILKTYSERKFDICDIVKDMKSTTCLLRMINILGMPLLVIDAN